MKRIDAVFIYNECHYVGWKLQAIPRVGDRIEYLREREDCTVEAVFEGTVTEVLWIYDDEDNDTAVHITIEGQTDE
jgi:hypothetical protein